MPNYTLTYSPDVQGFPSFYSYFPDYIMGMNQYLYTFFNGNLYRHNTNPVRNRYYEVNYNSTITGVINDSPLEAKVFKTIELESDSSWGATFVTDLQAGSIAADYFVQKEGSYFSFIRYNQNQENLNLRSTQGIGTCSTVTGSVAAPPIEITFTFSVDSILSVNDTAYKVNGTTIEEIGQVTAISADRTSITIGAPVADAVAGDLILYLKNPVAESYGMLGYYLEFTLTNTNTTATELFSVNSQVFKSFP